MSDGNPLVADRVDTTSAFAGAFLLQDGEDLANAISSGDWAAGALAVTSTALDTVGAIIDPIGTLIANGLGWVLDHIEPLKSWFNDFTGDAAEVASFSGTWTNTSGYIAQLANGYQGMLSQLDDMAGEGIDAYLGYANAVIANLRSAGEWSNAIAVGLQIASTLVQAVHDIVRDVLSQLVGSAISAAATTAATIGFGAPVAMAQFGTKVAGLVAKVSRVITKVLDALADLVRRLGPLGRAIEDVLSKIGAFFKRGTEVLHVRKPDADAPHTDLGHQNRPEPPHDRPEPAHERPEPAPDRIEDPERPRFATQAEYDKYVDSLETRDPKYGSPAARDFQNRHAGDAEYHIGSGDDLVWADGLKYDPQTGGVAVECKFVDSPGQSAINEGTAPPFLQNKANNELKHEIERYFLAIADGSSPLNRLDVVVSTPAAEAFLGQQIRQIMADMAARTGVVIEWGIRVGD